MIRVRAAVGGQATMTYGMGEDIADINAVTVLGQGGALQWTGAGPRYRVTREGSVELPPSREVDPKLSLFGRLKLRGRKFNSCLRELAMQPCQAVAHGSALELHQP